MTETSEIFFSCMPSTTVSASSATAATMVPKVMKGVRLPYLVLHLSDRVPKTGSRNTARILSSAMITPDQVWDIPNLLVRITGMVAS